MPKPYLLPKFFLLLALLIVCWQTVVAQTNAFNYQGRLTDAGNPANGTYDVQFKLFDTVTVGTGTQQGATLTNPTVQVTNGIFAVNLDFGANVFTGAARFLEIGVRPAGSPNPYTVLAPRQQITSSPYAIQTVNAQQLGSLPATRYVATDTIGNVGIGTATPSTKLEVVNPANQLRFGSSTADNGGYLISNNPSEATIMGGAKWDGTNLIARDTAASFTQHQFGAIRFFTNDNLSVGSPYSPTQRMLIESNGNVNIGGGCCGIARLTVSAPGFGILHGGSGNSAIMSYLDPSSGAAKFGTLNSHPLSLVTGNNPRITLDTDGKVGIGAVTPSTKLEVVDPVRQLRFGPTIADNGGYLISTVPSQAIITGGAKWDAPNWIARDTVASMTAHQFGAIEFYTNGGLAEGNPFSPAQRMVIEANGNVAIGTPSAAPGYKVDINSNGGGVRSFYNGSTHFVAETTGGTNAWAKFIMKTPNRQWAMGTSQNFNGDQLYIADETAGQIRMAINTNGYVSIGTTTPGARLYVVAATSETGVRGISTDGTGVSGDSTNNFGVSGYSANDIGVRGATGNPASYAGYFSGNVHVTGTVTQGSDARLKQNISKLNYGLSEVLRLRPVSWRWKAHPESGPQLGLVAQEVEPVLPELVSTDKDAVQTKGLNYVGLLPVLVNAIKEQQAQIEKQAHEIDRLKQHNQQQSKQPQSQIQLRQQIKQQRDEISRLKQLVCLDHPKTALCRKAY